MSKKIIILGAVAVLLAGGGAGGYFYFMQPAVASVADGHKKVEVQEKESEHGEVALEFVEIDPLVLPIIDNEGINQVVSIVVSLEVENATNAEKVKKMTPRLKDAYIQDMYGILNKNAALKDGVIQVGTIKERLNKVTDKVMGDKDVVHDVLLQVVQQRPI